MVERQARAPAPTRTSCTAARIRRCSRRRPATSSAPASSPSRRAARKELIVSYSQELRAPTSPTCCRCAGCPSSARSTSACCSASAGHGAPASSLGGDARATADGRAAQARWTPDATSRSAPGRVAGRARPAPRQPRGRARRARSADARRRTDRRPLVLFDTSASRALGFARAGRARSRELLAALRDGAGAATCRSRRCLRSGGGADLRRAAPAASAQRELRARSRERRALGASDLGARCAGSPARRRGRRCPRVLLVTDGVATAGATEARDAAQARSRALGAARRRAARRARRRRHPRRRARSRGWSPAACPRRRGARRRARRWPSWRAGSAARTRSGIAVAVEGAAWVWPQRLDGVQPGDEVLVYADLPGGPAAARSSLDGAGRRLAGAARRRRAAAARARLGRRRASTRLMHQRETRWPADADLRAALRAEIIELSVEHRVLSPVHRAPGARDRGRLRALRHRSPRARRHPHRRPGGLDGARAQRGAAGARRRPHAPAAIAKRATATPEADASRAPLRRGGARAGAMARRPEGEADIVRRPSRSATSERRGRRRPVERRSDLAALADRASGRRGRSGGVAERCRRRRRGWRCRRRTRRRRRRRRSAGESRAPPRRRQPAARAGSPSPPPPAGQRAPRPRRRSRGEPRTRRPRRARARPTLVGPLRRGDGRARRRPRRPRPRALAEAWQRRGPRRRAGAGRASARRSRPGDARDRGARLRLAHRSLPRPRRPAPLRRRAPRAPGRGRRCALAVDTYRKARRAAPRSPREPPPARPTRCCAPASTPRRFAALASGPRAAATPTAASPASTRILREDLGLVAAAWMQRRAGSARARSAQRLATHGAHARRRALAALRAELGDRRQRRRLPHPRRPAAATPTTASRALPSGGELYADVTTGYGPECFTIRGRGAAPTRTACRPTTTRAARWATAWASSRSSSTTARAACASRSGRSWS